MQLVGVYERCSSGSNCRCLSFHGHCESAPYIDLKQTSFLHIVDALKLKIIGKFGLPIDVE